MLVQTYIRIPTRAGYGLTRTRSGTVIPVLVLCIVGLCCFIALAVDVGMLTIAKTQAQNAADMAALTATRTLSGNSSTSAWNNIAATANAQALLSYNTILKQPIQATQLTLVYGSYNYSQTTQTFTATYPPTTGAPWTAAAATVVSQNLPAGFSTIFGAQFLPNVTCTAQAVHRPRDIAMCMDLSGSMRFGTCLGYDFYTTARVSNNPDALVPTFGHYSSSGAVMMGPTVNQVSGSENYTISPSNTTVGNLSYLATYINSYYQNAAYASPLIRAFDSYSSSDGGNTWVAPSTQLPQLPSTSYASTPGGDNPLFVLKSTATYAQTVNQVLGNASSNTAANIMWELDGYSAYAAGSPDTSASGSTPQVWFQADYRANASSPAQNSLPFNSYTQGPGYYGKTFFLWPPDPRNTNTVSGTTLQNYLIATGIAGTAKGTQTQSDAVTLASAWSTWQGNGSAGLGYLKTWLTTTPATTGTVSINGVSYKKPAYNYSAYAAGNTTFVYVPTSSGNGKLSGTTQTATTGSWSGQWNGSSITSAANMPSTYYAVCRLFNRAYPGGAAWTSAPISADWRTRFFGIGTTFNGTNYNNTYLFNSSGSLNPLGSNGMWPGSGSSAAASLLTYNAILSWLVSAPNPFPTQMRAGRIKYYGTIPTAITGSWPNWGSTDQRFWVEFMDNVLGFNQTASASYLDIAGISSSYALVGYGNDFGWGTVAISTPSTSPPYMSYNDNPARPLLRHWFSPIQMVDLLNNCNMYENAGTFGAQLGLNFFLKQPGNSYEAPIYTAKEAYVAAVATIQNNNPNDWFSTMSYSQPRVSASDLLGRQNCVSCPMGVNYAYANSTLLFPFSTVNADGSNNNTEVTPYDADPATGTVPSSNFLDIPRAASDTCFAMGLMLAYNQFAVTPVSDTALRTFVTNSPITFPTGMAGGLGRKGAQKVIIFETDGIPNCLATASLVTNGTYNYYKIRYDMNKPTTSEYPTVSELGINDPNVLSQIQSLITQLSSTYGTSRNPFRLYTIGFGPVFSGQDSSIALSTLQSMQYWAGTQSSASTSLPSNQVIIGTDAVMSASMISAYTTILQNGVQIALIQ